MRSCPACGTANRIGSPFCVGCSAPMPPAVATPTPTGSVEFSLPDYLRRDAEIKRRQSLVDDGAGTGLIWAGLPLAVGALLWSTGSLVGHLVWVTGLTAIVGGFWRMRRDRRALARAGLGTTAVGAVALGAVVLQLLEPSPPPDVPAALAPTSVADWETPPAAAGVPPGAVPMLGGGADRAGRHPGPGPVGRPTLRWRADTGGELYSAPTVVGDLVYVGTKSGFLSAIDLASGAERWRADLGGYIVRASPATVDGTVYIGAGYGLFALDAATGEERWRIGTRFTGASSPVVLDGVVYAATQEGHVYAVDAATSAERWHVPVEGLVFSSPAVADGRLFVGTDNGNLYAKDAASGRPLWDFATGGEIYASPAVVGGVVFVASTSGALFALDAATGDERWRAAVGGQSPPAVVGDTVLLGGEDGGLHAVDIATGATRWLFPTGHPVTVGPAVVGDTVYVASGPILYAVDLATGASRWAYPVGAAIQAAPAVVGGVVYVGGRDGFLYAIGGTESETAAANG